MTRRLTNTEAIGLIETVFEQGVDGICTGLIDATICDMDVDRARSDVASFLAGIESEIDADSIEIRPDHSDETDMPMVSIIIKTEG